MNTVFSSPMGGSDVPWMRPPRNEIPALVRTPDLVAGSSKATVFVAGLRVFSAGIEARFEVRFADGEPPAGVFDELTSLLRNDRGDDPAKFRVLLRYSDGSVASNRGQTQPVEPSDRLARNSPPVMARSGNAVIGAVTEISYWCWPLPGGPRGPRQAPGVVAVCRKNSSMLCTALVNSSSVTGLVT